MLFFFFKQKTAYDMRISDWSSDVCSSDLQNAEADKQAREEVEKVNAADALIFSTEKQLKDYGDKLPDDKKSTIEAALATLKDAHSKKDFPAIETATASLTEAWNAASEELYKASQAEGAAAGAESAQEGDAPASDSDDKDVKDVDFEEVKDDKIGRG